MCRLVSAEDFDIDKTAREDFLVTFCQSETKKWKSCIRYTTKRSLGFCPEFVMPDSTMNIDDIMDKFDEENQ